MSEQTLLVLTTILALGIGIQWLAWRAQLPAILLLLLAGFLAGPVAGIVHPDELFGDLLNPIVSVSVALILYEGGLTLDLREFRTVGRTVRNLISIGALATWIVATVAARVLLGLPMGLSILLGAILIVTGPTVIGPLLRQVRPIGRVGSILRWEGILIDPVGAVLAVLVFEAALGGSLRAAPWVIVRGAALAGVGGAVVGLAAAALIVFAIRYHVVPDFLHNAASITMVVTAFSLANLIQSEAGLVAATVMGMALASQRVVPVRHIVEFKENLRILLLSGLFIVLAARLDIDLLLRLGWREAAFIGILVLLARPLSVVVSAFRSDLSFGERAFLASVAPRGIVAASIASVFGLRLAEEGVAGADLLTPITFLVVAGTIAVYGSTAGLVARRLGLAERHPRGVLITGAHPLARTIADVLRDEGFDVLLADTDWGNIKAARLDGFRTFFGSVLSEHALDTLDLSTLGRVLALTSNDELNALVCQRFAPIVERANVYQLAPKNSQPGRKSARREAIAPHQRGRVLFSEHLSFPELTHRHAGGASVKSTPLTKSFDYAAFRERYGEEAVPLFVVTEERDLVPFAVDRESMPKRPAKLVSLIPPGSDRPAEAPAGRPGARG